MIEKHFLPDRIFRYFSPVASNILSEKTLRFASANQFNDIFEAFPRYDRLIKEQINLEIHKSFAFLPPQIKAGFNEYKRVAGKNWTENKLLQEAELFAEGLQSQFSDKFGIVCFSGNLLSLLMWGHYTNCHKGFVIEFTPGHGLFSTVDFGKVLYGKERPIISKRGGSIVFMHKSIEWEYENESRLVKHKSELKNDGNNYFIPLPMDSIKAIYFGCRISDEDRNKLLQPLHDIPQIEIFSMRRNNLQYKLDIIPRKKLNHR